MMISTAFAFILIFQGPHGVQVGKFITELECQQTRKMILDMDSRWRASACFKVRQ